MSIANTGMQRGEVPAVISVRSDERRGIGTMPISRIGTPYPLRNTMRFYKHRVEPAGSVMAELARDSLLSITTTKPARFVASCVQIATRRWDDFEITRSDLEELLATWSLHQLEESSSQETGQ